MPETLLHVPYAIPATTLKKSAWWKNFMAQELEIWTNTSSRVAWEVYLNQRLFEWDACWTEDRQHLIFKNQDDFMNLLITWG